MLPPEANVSELATTAKASASAPTLRVHKFLSHSRANGPGVRAVVWVQGCTLACPGCFNGPTHPSGEEAIRAGAGEIMAVDILFDQLNALALKGQIQGVTISGGEPLQQREGVAYLLRRIKAETTLSVILFTGFSWEELERMGQAEARQHQRHHHEEVGVGVEPKDAKALPLALLNDVDVLIAGRYVAQKRVARELRGSTNKQTYFLTERYCAEDLHRDNVPQLEIVVGLDGTVILTGIEEPGALPPQLELFSPL